MEENNPELESFRQQWRAEVSARSKLENSKTNTRINGAHTPKYPHRQSGQFKVSSEKGKSRNILDEDPIDEPAFQSFDLHTVRQSYDKNDIGGLGSKTGSREPRSALEHYEKAVERESQGNLGDSLSLYRKAFRMDDAVDVIYRRKHFPSSYFASKPSNPNPSNASQTVPGTGHHSLDGPPQTIKGLLASFEGLSIEPAKPDIEGTPAAPCPISTLPHEILVHILRDVAILDVAAFVQLAQVCKRLAYVVNTEEHIWRGICLDSEVGFGAMHYQWQTKISGIPLEEGLEEEIIEEKSNPSAEEGPPQVLDIEISSHLLLHKTYSSSWQKMFRLRPRIRFNGCYISTVNYFRPGQASPSQITWNSPVLSVTYYRYLRFFRDGTIISLLTTAEPVDVVHFLTKSFLESHKGRQGAHLPSSVMENAFRGRWRLSTASDNPEAELQEAEGDLYVETEGVGKYTYRMEFSLRSAGKGARNNKLVWKGYWHYNKLTNDSGEFGLKHDKPFFWSRVKSYGMGES